MRISICYTGGGLAVRGGSVAAGRTPVYRSGSSPRPGIVTRF